MSSPTIRTGCTPGPWPRVRRWSTRCTTPTTGPGTSPSATRRATCGASAPTAANRSAEQAPYVVGGERTRGQRTVVDDPGEQRLLALLELHDLLLGGAHRNQPAAANRLVPADPRRPAPTSR